MIHDSLSRFIVCSDIHANFAAFHAFLAETDKQGFQRIYCCGDSVGYGADPNECCDVLRARGIPTVLGNHDEAAIDITKIGNFNEIARDAIMWTHRALSSTNMDFLKRLPYQILLDDFTFVHASPYKPEKWNYILNMSDALECFSYFDTWICFIGHSHQPFVVELSRGGQLRCPEGLEIKLDHRKSYLVNVGSIGQPRDRIPLMSYVSVDIEKSLLSFHRIKYPVKEAQRAILDAGLPIELAERLKHGW